MNRNMMYLTLTALTPLVLAFGLARGEEPRYANYSDTQAYYDHYGRMRYGPQGLTPGERTIIRTQTRWVDPAPGPEAPGGDALVIPDNPNRDRWLAEMEAQLPPKRKACWWPTGVPGWGWNRALLNYH